MFLACFDNRERNTLHCCESLKYRLYVTYSRGFRKRVSLTVTLASELKVCFCRGFVDAISGLPGNVAVACVTAVSAYQLHSVTQHRSIHLSHSVRGDRMRKHVFPYISYLLRLTSKRQLGRTRYTCGGFAGEKRQKAQSVRNHFVHQ